MQFQTAKNFMILTNVDMTALQSEQIIIFLFIVKDTIYFIRDIINYILEVILHV